MYKPDRLKIWYGEWKFSQGSRSLIKTAASVAASGPGERNCNSCFANTPMDHPEVIERISSDKIPSATDSSTARFESPSTSNSPIIEAESKARICLSAYSVNINEFPDSSSSENDIDSEESSISIVDADDDRPFPVASVAFAENNFTKINDINDGTASGFVDVLGVTTRQNYLQTVPWSDDVRAKLMVELIDETRRTIWMVVRGSNAICLEDCGNLVIAAKRVQIRRRKNRRELVYRDEISTLIVEPEIDEAEVLRKWFHSEFAKWPSEAAQPADPVALIADLKDGQIANILGILTMINKAKVIGAKYVYDVARTVEIIDRSEQKIRLALWGDLAQDFAIPKGSVLYATNVKIYRSKEINGALTSASRVSTESRENEQNIERLQTWYAGYQKRYILGSPVND